MTADVVVVDLDNTLVRLEVDWDALRERLAEVAERAEVLVERHGIWPLMDAARQPGREPLLAEGEIGPAELRGPAGPRTRRSSDWLDANRRLRRRASLNSGSGQRRSKPRTNERVSPIVGRGVRA